LRHKADIYMYKFDLKGKLMFKNIRKNLTFKKQTKEDNNFLFLLYSSTREDELNMTTMNPRQKNVFLREQFDAKSLDYAKKFDDAEFLIVYKKKKAIGRVVYKIDSSVHLIDIAFVKKSRSGGYGGSILEQLLLKAKELKKVFELSVAVDNQRAIRLYQKLGLKVVNQHGYYYSMQKI